MLEPISNALRSWGMFFVALLNAAGAFLTGIFAIIRVLLGTKKPVNKIHETESEAEVNKAEAALRLTRAESIEFQDGLSGYEIFNKLLSASYELEQKLIEKNRIIADLEDKNFEQGKIIEEQAREIAGYEGQKLEILGRKRLEQSEEQKKNAG